MNTHTHNTQAEEIDTKLGVLRSVNERHVYLAGNEFGATHYITGESFEDAYDVYLTLEADHGNICDHGGDLTDEQVWEDGGCDCSLTDDGRFVWDVYLWMNETQLPVELFATDDDD